MAGVGDSSHERLAAKQMVAGAVGGALADGTMYPMMTVKSRLQVALTSNPKFLSHHVPFVA
jgi:hypothetical protein